MIAWFVQGTTKNAVTWLFAVKYWIIAYKVQLFQAGVNTRKRVFDVLIWGGLLLSIILMVFLLVINNIWSKKPNEKPALGVWCFWIAF